jgi:hypothetical protein
MVNKVNVLRLDFGFGDEGIYIMQEAHFLSWHMMQCMYSDINKKGQTNAPFL